LCGADVFDGRYDANGREELYGFSCCDNEGGRRHPSSHLVLLSPKAQVFYHALLVPPWEGCVLAADSGVLGLANFAQYQALSPCDAINVRCATHDVAAAKVELLVLTVRASPVS
jgi:hypothetical protein